MCTNPGLMKVYKLSRNDFHLVPRLIELHFNVNLDKGIAYKFDKKTSRDVEIEKIPGYLSHKIIEVGCGCCIECRLQYSKDWATRCYLESLSYQNNYFITLTYRDEDIHLGDTGNKTIDKADITEFIHALRDHFRLKYNFIGIRYFGCQEYGDLYGRPHAHIIFFNLPLYDLTIDIEDDEGQIIHKINPVDGSYYLWSRTVRDIWKKGNILIAPCNFNTATYVSRYILKKQKGEGSKIYTEELHIEPPYTFQSTRPGIGYDYLVNNMNDLLLHPKLYVPRLKNGKGDVLVTGLPRYFLKKVHDIAPDVYDELISRIVENIDAHRSVILEKSSINNQRSINEEDAIKRMDAFARDFKN